MRKLTLLLLALLIFTYPLYAQDSTNGTTTDTETLNQISAALQAKQFESAIKQIDVALDTAENQRDFLLYLKGLALFYNNQLTDAIQVCDQLLTAHPNSAWSRKTTFLKAQSYFKNRAFEQAEAIYSTEVDRLLSSTRKSEIAQVYIELAEAVTQKPEKGNLDAPPPNYQKAYHLYRKVLALEIDSDLREEMMFRLGRMMHLAKNMSEAIRDYQAYLAAFDKANPTPFNPATPPTPRPQDQKAQYRNAYLVRYHLAECQIAVEQHQSARLTLEDLLKLLENDVSLQQRLVKDAKFLLTRTYHFPSPRMNEELELGVQAAKSFLSDFPTEPRAMLLAYEIAQAYQGQGRSEEALGAYQDFLDGNGFNITAETIEAWMVEAGMPLLPPGTDSEISVSFTERHHQLQMSATFQIGDIRFSQRNYTDAIGAWTKYIREFPNGPQWTAAQQRIITTEFQIGITHLTEKQYDEAVRAFDAFQAKHPLDNRVRQIMLIYGQIHVHNAETAEKEGRATERAEAYQQAISEWDKLVSKYPKTEESSAALFRIGNIYEGKLGMLDKALESYRKLTWGSWHSQALKRIRQMTEKHLKLVTKRTFRTNETAQVDLSLRNIEALTVNLYKLNLESYWREQHDIKEIENLDLALITPDKTWMYHISDYQKYKPFEVAIDVPIEGTGVYAVQVGDDALESTTLVIRSDIEAITKTSRREVLVFAQDVLKGVGLAGAKVLVSDGKKVIVEGITGEDGVFRQKHDALKDAGAVTAFVVKDGHVAADRLSLEKLGLTQGLTARGYIYTDRPAYRPGHTVQIRGVIRNVVDGSYAVPDGEKYKIAVIDAQGRMIREEEVETQTFGTFNTQVQLDENAPVGEYRIQATYIKQNDPKRKTDGLTFTGNFQVQRFQLEKLQLSLNFAREVYFRGETVEATFTARYYYGQPAKGAKIKYHTPDGQSYTKETDDNGKLEVTFDTALMRPGSAMYFRGDIEGENVTVERYVILAHLGYRISVQPPDNVVLSGEPFDVSITTIAANGKPVEKTLTVKVIQQQVSQSPPHPILSHIPGLSNYRTPRPGEVVVSEQQIETDTATGRATMQLTLTKGAKYTIRANGVDRFGQAVIGFGDVTVSDDSDAIKLRIFATRGTTEVGKSETICIHSRLGPGLALVTFVGEGIIDYKVSRLQTGMNPLEYTVEHQHFPNFYLAVATIDGQQLRTTRKHFTVRRELKVYVDWQPSSASKIGIGEAGHNVEPFPIYAPGERAEVRIRATDQLGNPVKAELSLALVDEAVFAVYADTVTPITDFFQKGLQRKAEMRTASSCTFRYEPPTRPVIKEILAEAERLEEADKKDADELKKQIKVAGQNRERGRRRMMRRSSATRAGSPKLQVRDLVVKPVTIPIITIPTVEAITLSYGEADVVAGVELAISMPEAFKSAIRKELTDAGHWIGAVVTDDAGMATVNIPMPTKTTKWRLTARGCTVDTLVGQILVNTITRKDFFLDLKIPPIVTEGDKIRVHGRLHNLTEFEGEAEVKLEINVDGQQTILPKTVTVKKKDTTDFIFDPIKINQPTGTFNQQLTLSATAHAGTMTDGVQRDIPIRPWGIEYADTQSGATNENTMVFLELPSNQHYTRKQLTIDIGGSVSRLIYKLALGRYHPQRVLKPAITSSIPMPGDTGSDLLALAYALGYVKVAGGHTTDNRELFEAARAGIGRLVTTQNKDGGWNWIGITKHGDSVSSARVTSRNLWALTEARKQGVHVDAGVLAKATAYLKNRFAKTDQKDDETKAIILHALSTVDAADFAYANRLYRRRNQLTSPALAYTGLTFVNLDRMEIAGEVLDVFTATKEKGAGAESQVETTAVALLAMEAVRPNSPWVKTAVEYLLAQRRYYGYSPYKAKGPAVAALATYYQQTQFTSDDYKLTISANDREIQTVTVRRDAPNYVINAPVESLKDGQNKVKIEIDGRGRYTYLVKLSGFSAEMPSSVRTKPDSKTEQNRDEKWDKNRIQRHYYHATLEYRGRPISTSTTQITQLASDARTRVSLTVDMEGIPQTGPSEYLVIDEYIPAGTTIVADTITGDFRHYELGDGVIRFYYIRRNAGRWLNYNYQLVSYAPGDYRVLPAVIRNAMHPHDMWLGHISSLTVLAPGETSTDRYKMNKPERFALGTAYFNDGIYSDALPLLAKLHALQPELYEKDTARMLLWIYTTKAHYNARKVIEVFEILRERYPELYIPFDKIRVVGAAYRDIEEFERATLVYQSTISSSFANDSNISAVLQDEGQFMRSIAFMENLWREYPDTASAVSAHFALSQALYAKASEPITKQPESDMKPADTKNQRLKRTVTLLSQFLTLYPTSPLADDAAFSLANALLDLEDFETVVRLCQLNQERYPDSDFLTSFQYVEALGLFSMLQYDKAIRAATFVASSQSEDRDFARYILGQIYHAQGKPAEAISWYNRVKENYPDAKESIAYFEEKRIALPEVTVKRPKTDVVLTLKYRNIKEAAIQVYSVDLMKLYLREKDLRSITQVRLAGIEPAVSQTVSLGDGKDYIDKTREIPLPLTKEGAYLVICRGDNLFTSGLILVTPLEIEVQEDTVSGRVRVNVRDAVVGNYLPKVHVKAVASADGRFRSGETDLRGIFVADGMRGKSTIIARDSISRYAFYRGTKWLGAPETESEESIKEQVQPVPQQQLNYREHLERRNQAIQSSNIKELDRMRRDVRKGVQVQSAY